MGVSFEAIGTGGKPKTFDGRATGFFEHTHPGADGPNSVVEVWVAGYRSTGRAVITEVTYGDVVMTPKRQVWGNGAAATAPKAGWLQCFVLTDPPPGPQTWRVTWISPLGSIAQIQMCANSISHTGVASVGAEQIVTGAKFTTAMEQLVTAPPGALIVQGFLHEWFNAITDYNRSQVMRLDDDKTVRPYDAVIGEAAGGPAAVKFSGKRALGAAWCGYAVPLIAKANNVIQAPPAELTLTGMRPHDGRNVIVAPPARLKLTGGTAAARKRTVIRPAPAELHIETFEPWTGLPVPAEATVLTLRGLNALNLIGLGSLNPDDMAEKFQGIFAEPPYELHAVKYPASLAPYSITKGVEELDKALHFYDPPFIVVAQSQGAQVASAWMDLHRDDPDAPAADELTVIVTGNPVSAKGGYLIGRSVVGGGVGVATPTDTKWTVIDVARRYEGWTDWVQDETDSIAVQNAMSGRNTLHMRYDEVDLFDPTHTIWRVGNTFFVLTQEADLPYFKGKPQKASLVAATRARIERAYTNRPPNDPPVELVDARDPFERNLIQQMLATP